MKRLRERPAWLAAVAGAGLLLAVWLCRPAAASGVDPDGGVPAGLDLLAIGGALAAAVFWWRRRQARTPLAGTTRLRCLERIRLEPGRQLHLVEADGCRLLLASGEQGLSLLTRLDRPPAAGGAAGEGDAP